MVAAWNLQTHPATTLCGVKQGKLSLLLTGELQCMGLQTALAAALREEARTFSINGCGTDERLIEMAATVGPLLAVLFGIANELQLSSHDCAKLRQAARREMRQLALAIGVTGAEVRYPMCGFDVADLMLQWSQTPVVPTYNLGARYVCGHVDEASRNVAVDLALEFHLFFSTKVKVRSKAPLLNAIAEGLLAKPDEAGQSLAGAVDLGDRRLDHSGSAAMQHAQAQSLANAVDVSDRRLLQSEAAKRHVVSI